MAGASNPIVGDLAPPRGGYLFVEDDVAQAPWPIATQEAFDAAALRLPHARLQLTQDPAEGASWFADLSQFGSMASVREWVTKSAAQLLMWGDCWHFALALHRRYDLPIVGWQSEDGHVQHVVGSLNSEDPSAGPYLDIRGVFDTPDLFEAGFGSDAPRGALSPVSMVPEDIHAQLRFYSREDPEDPATADYPFSLDEINDPERYPFASWCEWLAEFLYDDTIRMHRVEPRWGRRLKV